MTEARRKRTAAVTVTGLLAGLVSALTGLDASASIAASVAAPAVASVAAAPASAGPGTYVTVAVARILDTRSGIGVRAARVAAHGSISFAATGVAGVPSASGVSAVVFNLTATNTTANGFICAYPAGAPAPLTSTLNFAAGDTRAHSVVVAPGASGKVTLHNASAGALDLLADVAGYYTAGTPNAGGEFAPLTSARLLDTRIGVGAPRGPMRHGVPLEVQLTGRGGIPSSGVSAVVLNLTVTQPSTSGYLNTTPASSPGTSINFAAGQTVSNLVAVALPATGTMTLLSFMGGDLSATVQVVADVSGYFRAGAPSAPGRFGSLNQTRLVDTRVGGHRVLAHGTLTVAVAGQQGIPLSGITAAVLNVAVAAPKGSGHVTAYPSGSSRPATSTVNFARHTVSDAVMVAVGSDGNVRLYNDSTSVIDLVVDVSGFVGPIPGRLSWSGRTAFPTDTTIFAVSCASSTFCAAVGGAALFFDGTTWSAPQTVSTDFLVAVSCPVAGFCVALSYNAAYVYTAGTWTRTTLPGPTQSLRSISCRSSSFCLAADAADETHAWKYDGSAWTSTDTGIAQSVDEGSDPNGLIVTCASTTLCLGASAGADGATARFDGSSWTALSRLSSPASSISCPSTTHCVAISLSQVFTFDGTSWGAPVRLPDPGYVSTRVSCGSTTSCVAATQGADLQFYDSTQLDGGTGWTTPVSVNVEGVRDISCPDASFCLAVGSTGAIIGT